MKPHKFIWIGMLVAMVVFISRGLWLPVTQQVFQWWLETPEDQELIILRPNAALGLDPARLTDQESLRITTNIFECLVRFDPLEQKIRPALAQSWSASEDGREWRFQLQEDVLFHDGTPFNAHAVVFNFQRWMDVNNPYHTGTFNYWSASFGYDDGIVLSVEALGDYTLRIVLSEPYAPFLETLALPSFGISSPQSIKTYNDGVMYNPVGTGPFQLAPIVWEDGLLWEGGTKVTLQRNPRYWSTRPGLSRIHFETVTDEAERLARIQAGTAHIAEGISEWQDQPGDNYRLVNRPYNNVGYLAFNLDKNIFKSQDLRAGIAMAIDKEGLVQRAFPGDTRIASGFVPPVVWGYHEKLEDYLPKYNPTKARATLKQALDKLKAPLEGPLKILVMQEPRAYFQQPLVLAQAIADQLNGAGLLVAVEVAPWKEVVARGKLGAYDMLLAGWIGDIPDPDNYLYTLFASQNSVLGNRTNYAAYQNPQVDQALLRARASYDTPLRAELYRQIQELIAADLPAIPLVHTRPTVAVSNAVQGYATSLSGDERLDLVTLKQVAP